MTKVSRLYDHTGYWLDRFRGVVHTQFERRLAAHGVTVSQWCLLITLFNEEADTVRDIARIIRLDGGAVTRLANRLEAGGLIRRQPDPADGRSVRLELTARGRSLTPTLAAAADATDEQFMGALSDREVAVLKNLLTKLLSAANDSPDKEWGKAPLKRGAFDQYQEDERN